MAMHAQVPEFVQYIGMLIALIVASRK